MTELPVFTGPWTCVLLSTTNSIVCFALAPWLTSRVNECPPLPIAATVPETDLVAAFGAWFSCGWSGACCETAEIPSIIRPASEAHIRNFRIMGYPLLNCCGVYLRGVKQVAFHSWRQVKEKISSAERGRWKQCAKVWNVDC